MLTSIMIVIIVNSHRTGMNCTECVCVNHVLMDFPFWFDIINLGWSIVYIQASQVCISFSDDIFVLANSVNPVEILHDAAFHQRASWKISFVTKCVTLFK